MDMVKTMLHGQPPCSIPMGGKWPSSHVAVPFSLPLCGNLVRLRFADPRVDIPQDLN
jgi:hypothetical protein